MKKYAAVAVIAVLAMAGCASATALTAAAPAVKPAAVAPAEVLTFHLAVQRGWLGNNVPDEKWIDTAALLVCKQIIGGHEPRAIDWEAPDADIHARKNEAIFIAAAEHFVCEIDRDDA